MDKKFADSYIIFRYFRNFLKSEKRLYFISVLSSEKRWAHIVCALFIEEVRFHDPETSTGIIIDDIPSSKKVLDGVRSCFYCKKAGFVVKCCCDDKSCGKWVRLYIFYLNLNFLTILVGLSK